MESESKPETIGNLVRIRENLQKYYEVVDHEKSTLKCRLAGLNDCKVNGMAAVFTYSPRRGWNNFERHLKRVHKFSAEEFIEGKRQRLLQRKRKAFNIIMSESGEGESSENTGSGSKRDSYLETQFISSIAKEKYCVVCRDECHVNLDDQDGMITDELDFEQLKFLFPGGGECMKLCHQLFFIFFLRKIVGFPSERCQVFLKKCKGLRTPETWFFLCAGCRGIALQAAEIHEKLKTLQRDMENIKKLVRSKCLKDDARSFDVPLSSIEEEIRIYLKDPPTGNHNTSLQNQSVGNYDLDAAETAHDDEWTTHEEVERKCETGFKDAFFSLKGSNRPTRSCKKVEEIENETGGRIVRQPSNADLTIVKVEAEPEDEDYRVFQPEDDNDDDNLLASYSDTDDRDYEVGSETEEPTTVTNPIRIRDNLKKYFKVINHKLFTIKCRLAGKHDCKMDGVLGKLKYSPQCGWYNFERHLVRVHKLSQADIILGKGLHSLDSLSNTETSNRTQSKSKQKLNKSIKRAKKTASKKSFTKPNKRYQPLERDKGEGTDDGGIKSVKFYVCQLCPTKYKCSGSLREHLEAHEMSKTLNNKYDCQKCGYPCHSEFKNKKHFSIKHASEDGVPCSLCDYLSPTQREMAIHLKKHKDEAEKERVGEKYLCKLCNRLFVTYDILCKHKRTEHYKELGVVPLRCGECSLIFSTKRLLRDHVQQTHKKESRFFCDICGRGMMYMSKLRRHMNGHMKDRCFVCEICGADFQYDETLRLHIKKDHPDVVEAEAGTSKNNLATSTSSEAVKFTCKHCNELFGSSTLLFRHIKTHTELYANKCKLCGKGYVTPQSLRRHVEINHSTNEVPCKFCGKIFPHQEYIRMHYRFCKNYPGERRRIKASDGEPLEDVIVDGHSQNTIDDDILRSMMMSSELSNEMPSTSVSQHSPTQEDVEVKMDPNNTTSSLPSTPCLVPVTSVINAALSEMNQAVIPDSE